MGTLEFLGSDFAFEKYRPYLERTAERLYELRPTSIISLARKGPRLLQLMREMGISLPAVPHWTDQSLTFLTEDDIGSTPVIFDDVVILGTSLYSFQNKIKAKFNKIAHIVAVVADSDNFRHKFVEHFHPTVFFDEPHTQSFSSELIRSIALLGLPYDVDHPVFSFDMTATQGLLSDLLNKCERADKERLSAQYEDKVEIMSFHLPIPVTPVIKNFHQLVGKPELFKIKVIRSLVRNDIRFLPVSCFPPLHKKKISDIWSSLRLPHKDCEPLGMYRVLCFAGAILHAEACDERIGYSSLLIQEAKLTLGSLGVDVLQLVMSEIRKIDCVQEFFPEDSRHNANGANDIGDIAFFDETDSESVNDFETPAVRI